MGLNKNHSSRTGTLYHLQVEDRGPVFDEAAEEWVRRLNVIAYANYGEPTARIVYGKDHDLPDTRTHEHNRLVAQRIQELAAEVPRILEEKEERQVGRVKSLLERYYRTRDDEAKKEFEDANRLYPLIFARAFQELKAVRPPAAESAAAAPPAAAAPVPPAAEPQEVVYPLDAQQREVVLEIERVAEELKRDLDALKRRGAADDILQATCAKLLARAKDSLTRNETPSEFAARYLDMTRNSLVTAYRQVRARLTRVGG
jgi:pyruvate/2-oxoglutarate dehydrogenase complex dihydrolipoamide acyltransferase (E2) component